MKEIPLTQGQVALVDDEDYEQLSQFKWYAHWNNSTGRFIAERFNGATRQPGSKRGWLSRSVSMQKEIMGTREGFEIDHRNLDSLDNQRANLRWATRRQNSYNRVRPNKTGYKGVFFNGFRFTARITAGGRRFSVGTFERSEDAAEAYNLAAVTHFGEFAKLNEIKRNQL